MKCQNCGREKSLDHDHLCSDCRKKDITSYDYAYFNQTASNLSTSDTQENLPDPVGVLRGFKAIGYSIEEALSDLIDNSIDAKAKNVVIEFGRNDEDLLFIRVIDDGEGIEPKHIDVAMKWGGASTKDSKSLGCFGLGMKTAAFAIADSLTVVSKASKKKAVGRRWTAKNIEAGWKQDYLDDKASENWLKMDYGEIDISKSGTVVQLDNIQEFNIASGQVSSTLDRIHKGLRFHIGVHFHRFLEKNKINIYITTVNIQSEISTGYESILPINPMPELTGVKEYPKKFTLDVAGGKVNINAHIWPKKSNSVGYKMNGKAPDYQGFFWYRNDRLIDHGWSKLRTIEPHMNLARAVIDLPPKLDNFFGLQVGKYKVEPPRVFLNSVLSESKNKDGESLKLWVKDAETLYRTKPKTEPKISAVIPGDGFGDNKKIKIYRELFSQDSDTEEIVKCSWKKLETSQLFEIDTDGFELTINSNNKLIKKMNSDTKELLAISIFLGVQQYYLLNGLSNKHEEEIELINKAFMENLK
ncbi:MAG: hypothetical protein CL470_08090 [Acidimicrobiaceae bacterium]|nr:hypothetical protein [Acidimicrobiaceae bacterium]